ncbi:MAG TPA: tRNA lysidine(34) synthetase TilS [bacterium]|nr:tRNA lysidine(34) synthetase TilS [bacterium]
MLGQRILLAVSGGLDSMAMLHLFLETREKLKIIPIVAHINHNLRPDSGRDAQFVDNFCQEHGVECYLSEINEEFWDSGKGNIEDRARRERYRLLEKISRKCRVAYIATAHHRDDQVETVLMRILDRGTGLQGLGGIAELSASGKINYLRPLLRFSRRQLADYMADRAWIEDISNADIDIRRNLFRHEVIPRLEKVLGHPVGDHVARLAETAGQYDEVLSVALNHFWETHRRSPRSRAYLLTCSEIANYPDAFWLAAIAHLVRQARGYTFGARTLKDMVGFLRGDSAFASYQPLTIRKDKLKGHVWIGLNG